MEHTYWGAAYTNLEIEEALKTFAGIDYHLSEDVCGEAAVLLAEGNVVGWFQGRFEVGPRALGNRSILGHPALPDMKDRINLKVKNRESWRPFAPSVLEEEVGRYVDISIKSPYMILAFQAKEETKDEIISAIHVDGTCRPQTVSQNTNPRYWQLIHRFGEITGVPVVLNTSFNVKGQPIVNTPEQAIDTFLKCGMDVLAMGDYIVRKQAVVEE
jgi:carbamoyltransferase